MSRPRAAALVVANHVSWADGVLLGLACPRHPRMVAYAKYFESRWLNWFGRIGRIIPSALRRKSMAESIRQAREALQDGEIVVFFPRATSATTQMHEFRPGFLAILKDLDVPVVPAYLDGLWGSIFSFEGGKVLLEMAQALAIPVSIRFGPADRESGERGGGPAGGGGIGGNEGRHIGPLRHMWRSGMGTVLLYICYVAGSLG